MINKLIFDLICSRRRVLSVGASLGAAAALSNAGWAQTLGIAAEIAGAARNWLAVLDDKQRAEVMLPWNGPRENWHYTPRSRPGLALGEMDEKQREAVWHLLGTVLSVRGRDQIRGTLRLEAVLGELTRNPGFRDPDNYAVVIFGDPARDQPWSWRFEGHHLSLTTVIVPEQGISVTPAFFGANPAKVPNRHKHAVFRLLGKEEDTAFQLIRSLEGGVRAQAVIKDRSLGDIVAGPGRETALQSFEGASLVMLNEAQRQGVFQIAQLFADTMRTEIADAAMARLREAGADGIHFAWAGSLERGSPHYFRIHAPRTLIEYDNTQNGANHVHSVWIDPENVFGRDLLRAHYEGAH